MRGYNRLPNSAGLFINPAKPVNFTFEGKTYQGVEGDTIASALIANDQWLMSRSFKYHRPRGPLTMAELVASGGNVPDLIKPFSMDRFDVFRQVNEMGATAASH